ncbi:IS3 family transposase, partial [bacterium]|nr:IS3 family transposase [bacterium]
SVRVIALLEELIAQHGAPRAIRCDNGPEFTSWARHTAADLSPLRLST